jgi:hypothetical protein
MRFTHRSWLALALAVCLSGGPAARAAEPGKEGLQEVVAKLADGVRKVAAKLEQPAVRIGFFSPFGIDDSNAGAAFMAELAAALKDFVNPGAALELQGSYGFVENPEKSGLKAIVVRTKLVRVSSGAEEKEFPAFEGFIRAVPDIARIMGPGGVAFKPDKDSPGRPSEDKNRDIQNSLPPGPGQPPAVQAHVHGPGDTLVSATKDSLYDVEIRSRPLADPGVATPRKVELKNGLPFVPIDKGEVYEVRVVNRSRQEIAVSLAVDGIDVFAFSDDRVPVTDKDGREVKDSSGKVVTRQLSHFIVDPVKEGRPGEVLIPGWHKTAKGREPGKEGVPQKNFLSFLVTEYGKGAVSRFPTPSRGKVGTIVVGIALAYPPGDKGVGVETGFGPPVEVIQEVVERRIDSPHEFVTVRYSR